MKLRHHIRISHEGTSLLPWRVEVQSWVALPGGSFVGREFGHAQTKLGARWLARKLCRRARRRHAGRLDLNYQRSG